MKKNGIMASVLILCAMVFPTAVANAAAMGEDGIITLPPGISSGSAQAQAQIDAALNELVGTQTPDEIAVLARMPGTTILYDWETDTDLAAVNVRIARTARAITQLGPGCSTTSMCLTQTNKVGNGYIGTGAKTIHVANVIKTFAGDHVGSVTHANGEIKVLGVGVTLRFNTPFTARSITRG